MDCIFCAIVRGDIPSKKVYEDELCYAFLDIQPQAPVHCLVVPREHIALGCVDGHIYYEDFFPKRKLLTKINERKSQ